MVEDKEGIAHKKHVGGSQVIFAESNLGLMEIMSGTRSTETALEVLILDETYLVPDGLGGVRPVLEANAGIELEPRCALAQLLDAGRSTAFGAGWVCHICNADAPVREQQAWQGRRCWIRKNWRRSLLRGGARE